MSHNAFLMNFELIHDENKDKNNSSSVADEKYDGKITLTFFKCKWTSCAFPILLRKNDEIIPVVWEVLEKYDILIPFCLPTCTAFLSQNIFADQLFPSKNLEKSEKNFLLKSEIPKFTLTFKLNIRNLFQLLITGVLIYWIWILIAMPNCQWL